MNDLTAGLDRRAYDFEKINGCPNPLWRSHDCKEHGGCYEDIVAVMETTANVERMLRPCCLEAYNGAADVRREYWRIKKDTPDGKEWLAKMDKLSAEMLRNISTTI